jgi:hypothetical protein
MKGKRNKWIKAVDAADGKPIPHSGGEGKQLKGGFDARNRVTSTYNNILKTPDILNRNPSRIPIKPGAPVSTDKMPPPISHSGSRIAVSKLRPNQKPPRKDM